DLLSSVGVIFSAIIIYFTGLLWFDPLSSIVISCIIFIGGSRIIKESYHILMESVPAKFNLEEIRRDTGSVEGVEDVHEMHLWAIST
ncbi:cation diffusion facilitator family transporter, partial [Paenibacillus sp. GbtcB18]|uniref:cation diffusion facilitator family transporter n=1 Tax=Paenibacillus sp. GbtcB18 TaxID=2824763 RepID=UPI001C30F84B